MLNWNSIDTVLLDMDGTLLDLHFDNHFWQEHLIERYAEFAGISIVHSRQHLDLKFAATAGTLDWYCLDFWSRELSVDIVALKREVEHLVAIHPYAEEFLTALRGKKRLVLVTNAHPDSLNLKLQRTGISVYFDEILSAHRFRLPKEHPAFWPELQSVLAFEPQRTLLVEDNVKILYTAKHYGIKHLLAITKPDSRGKVQEIEGFPAIENFGQLLPINF